VARGESLEERFWSKIDKSGSCWAWTSAFTTRGYGFFWVGGAKRSEYAHRVAWELSNGGKVPDGSVVMHSCDNPKCVNPAHLSIGTPKDNAQDCKRKGRNAFGERNMGGQKLTWEKVREIRKLSGHLGRARTARKFGVSENTIKMIRQNRLWREAE
jgi:hypothetical protein